MFKKSAIAVAAVVLTGLSVTAPAMADNANRSVRDHRVETQTSVRDHRQETRVVVRDHRTKAPVEKQVRDHRTKRSNEVVAVKRKHCRVGYENLRRGGYRPIVAYDCQGSEYHYTAQRGAKLYRVAMNAYSGSMEVIFVGLAR
ncbi:hypothetical protein DYI23_16755 [Roseibium polysiphoniae]|uniref:Secreted protein n=1 Tax=Roseibium polysiphoniae TaxID=2571221 RepID=A0A944CED1_9HYPH|nr:hypothetical protein [Roseibium polysiphoniae]MBS8261881.1 hypothetical protein [Roseibium polysiphoniae]